MTSPTPAPPAPSPAPSSILSLTDPATWAMVLSVVAAVVLNVWHRDVSAYVPLASVGVAGLVVTGGLVAKHRYAAAVDSMVALVDRLESTRTVVALRAQERRPAAPEAAGPAPAPPTPAPAPPRPPEAAAEPPPLTLETVARLLRAAGYHLENPPPASASVSVPPPAPAAPSPPVPAPAAETPGGTDG